MEEGFELEQVGVEESDLAAAEAVQREGGGERKSDVLEIVEALLLAFVTILTAWSGYQAARWDGNSALYYGQASKERTQANKLATLGSQQQLYNITTFNTWLTAKAEGHTQLAAFLERRFTPEYAIAFNAWLQTDPFHNPYAPPGPIFMKAYHNTQLAQSDALEAKAGVTFERGTNARETADEYVRVTLVLASILFLIAIGQRFKVQNVRRSLLGLAAILLVASLYIVTTFPID
jgi:hypothetical protein